MHYQKKSALGLSNGLVFAVFFAEQSFFLKHGVFTNISLDCSVAPLPLHGAALGCKRPAGLRISSEKGLCRRRLVSLIRCARGRRGSFFSLDTGERTYFSSASQRQDGTTAGSISAAFLCWGWFLPPNLLLCSQQYSVSTLLEKVVLDGLRNTISSSR